MSPKSLSLASLLLLLGACAAPTGEKSETSESTEQDITLKQLDVVGSVDLGETTTSTKFNGGTKYVGLKFSANAGDDVDVWVKSKNGDPVAWILDNDFKTIAKNDDAAANDTNSHIKLTLPANASATHYIVVRDYWQSPMSFKVTLAGGTDYTGTCSTDSDCVRVTKTCCSNLGETAVLTSKAAAYTASLACQQNQVCPKIATLPNYGVAECNRGTHKCEVVQPADIACGGFIAPVAQHACPSGYSCQGSALLFDAPGHCVQSCGGFAGIQCHAANESCVDNPNDACDAANGGADCGGICQVTQ